jgi:hypothetical protein
LVPGKYAVVSDTITADGARPEVLARRPNIIEYMALVSGCSAQTGRRL